MGLNVPFILSKIVVKLACIADPNIKSPILRAGRGPYINSHMKLFLVSMHESTSGQPRPQGAFSKPVSQRFGHPRVLGIPIPKSLAFWASPSHITAAFWASPGTLQGCPNP